MSSTRYELVFGVADKSLSGPPTSAERGTLALPQPRTQSRIDSWAFITE